MRSHRPRRGLRAALAGTVLATVLGLASAQVPKVLTVARDAQFETLDPARIEDTESADLARLVYSTLVQVSYLERPYRLEPDLLVRMPEVSADQLTYTFELRPGVFFHDDPCFPGGKGRQLVADDVLASLKRFADANINTKSWHRLAGAVVGLDEFRAASVKPGFDPARTAITGFQKLGPLTFTLRLTQPNPRFLWQWRYMPMAVVPPEAVAYYKDRFGVNPVGTGPFQLKNAERKGVLRLHKYPRYHGVYPSTGAPGDAEKGLLKDAGKRLPLVDVVELPLIEEAQPAMLKLLKGELDWGGIDRANFSRMVDRPGPGQFRLKPEFAARLDLYQASSLSVTYTTLNLKDPLLGSNKVLRQAIARLFDAQAEIDLLRNGRGIRLNSLVPIEVPGSERDTGARWPAYDLAEARRLLALAGYPGGKGLPPLRLIIGDPSSDGRNMGDLYTAKFAAVGVQLKPEYLDWPSQLKAYTTGHFQLAASGWRGDADAATFYALVYGKNTAPGPNHGVFAHPDYDRAYEAARLMPDGPQRLALFKTMNEILLDEVPLVPAYNPLSVGITQKWLRNFKRNVLAPPHMYLDVDMVAKKKGMP